MKEETTTKKLTTTKAAETLVTTSICSDGDGMYADKSRDCKFYYKCIFTGTKYARKIEASCSPNTYFNNKERKCTSDFNC